MNQQDGSGRPTKQFQLLTYFSVTSLMAFVAVTGVLVVLYGHLAKNDLIRLGEMNNFALTQAFANSIWPDHAAYFTTVKGLDGDGLRARPETAEIRESVLALMRDVSVIKVKVYNLDGLTFFPPRAVR